MPDSPTNVDKLVGARTSYIPVHDEGDKKPELVATRSQLYGWRVPDVYTLLCDIEKVSAE
jgi:hypothetical protein